MPITASMRSRPMPGRSATRSWPHSGGAITGPITRQDYAEVSRCNWRRLSDFSSRDWAPCVVRGAFSRNCIHATVLYSPESAWNGSYRLFLAACRRADGNLYRYGARASVLYRFQPIRRGGSGGDGRGAVGDARTRPSHHRTDGGRSCRRGNGRRNRDDARNRSDRRADAVIDRPAALSGVAATARGADHIADPGAGSRHHRCFRRISRRRLSARFQSRSLSQPHAPIPRDERCRFGSGQGGRIRLYRRADGLLPRLLLARGSTRGRSSDDLRGRFRLCLDPRLQLPAYRSLFWARTNGSEVHKIAVAGLCKSFGNKRVLDGVEIDCTSGESLVIIGGSGTGKSVLVKCILGLLHPEAGSIRVDGAETVGLQHAGRERLLQKFGMLFQGGALFDSLAVWENVAFGLMQGRGVERQAAKQIALAKLAAVGLGPEVSLLRPAELSGGMQKRVALARAIAAEPEVVFFDEPTTGLDPIMADIINNLIVKCVREVGATAVSITHDLVSARKIADRIAMLHQGRIIWCGPTAEIDHSGNPVVDQFINGRAEGPIKMEIRAG